MACTHRAHLAGTFQLRWAASQNTDAKVLAADINLHSLTSFMLCLGHSLYLLTHQKQKQSYDPHLLTFVQCQYVPHTRVSALWVLAHEF